MIKSLTIIGPFATEYSLARVNRALALALRAKYPNIEVRLWADAEHCDRLPAQAEYSRYPFLKELYSKELGEPDVVIYNNFPKSQYAAYGLSKISGKIKLGYLAWEETVFPKRWAEECNQHLHGLLVTSEHVRSVFRASGITIPMFVISEGLDIPNAESEVYKIKSRQNFKFLHISSAQYRKGVDVLLKAYLAEFSNKDAVSLILKLFPNASHDKEVNKLLANRTNDSAEVEIINDNSISDGQLKYLYESCNVVVLPSRAEGYGLPMAEAMRLKKPLITTGFSGHMDFCNNDNCFLLKYKLVDSKSHLNIPGAKVAEPDVKQLQSLLRYLYEQEDAVEVKTKINNAYLASIQLTWQNAATECIKAIESIEKLAALKTKKIAVISTWNSRCGIAEYSRNLYYPIISSFKDFKVFANYDIGDRTASDEAFVMRNWQYGEMSFDKLIEDIDNYQPDMVQFQYNSSFYSAKLMAELAKRIKGKGISVYITFHSVNAALKEVCISLKAIDTILVHSASDLNALSALGLSNIKLIEHGFISFRDEDKQALRKEIGLTNNPIIASHGLIHDKKGILETLAAVNILKKEYPNICYLVINALNPNNSTSSTVYKQMQQYIKLQNLENHVVLISDFLKTIEVVKLLQLADIVVLAYADVQEGASGAVRTSIGAKRPIMLSQSYIFNNLDIGIRIPDNKPETIANTLSKLLKDKTELARLQAKVVEYNQDHNWEKASLAYLTNLL